MMVDFFVILITALLSSFLTIAIAYYIIKQQIQTHAEERINQIITQFENEIGPIIEARVKQGVRDGVASIPSREVIRETTRTIAKTGADIVGDTLKPLLNRSPGRRTPKRNK